MKQGVSKWKAMALMNAEISNPKTAAQLTKSTAITLIRPELEHLVRCGYLDEHKVSSIWRKYTITNRGLELQAHIKTLSDTV